MPSNVYNLIHGNDFLLLGNFQEGCAETNRICRQLPRRRDYRHGFERRRTYLKALLLRTK